MLVTIQLKAKIPCAGASDRVDERTPRQPGAAGRRRAVGPLAARPHRITTSSWQPQSPPPLGDELWVMLALTFGMPTSHHVRFTVEECSKSWASGCVKLGEKFAIC